MKPQKKELCKITFTPKGDYDSSKEYEILDIVNYNKCTYLAKCNVPANTFVTNKNYWMEVYLVEGTSNGGVGMLFYNGNNIGEIFNDYGNNKANGNNSHVEGKDNIANGMTSHVEGWMNTSYGDNSHIEGCRNYSIGHQSHTEGYSTFGYGNNSHCEGKGDFKLIETTISDINYEEKSFVSTTNIDKDTILFIQDKPYIVYNNETLSNGKFKITLTTDLYFTLPVEKVYNILGVAFGDNSHNEGYGNISINENTHAEGYMNTVAGTDAHVEGSQNKINGNHAHGEGCRNNSTGVSSHIEGEDNFNNSNRSHVEGNLNKNYGVDSHIEGTSNYNSSDKIHVEGTRNAIKNGCDNSHIEGYNNTLDKNNKIIHLEGNTNNVDTECYDLHVEGKENKIKTGTHYSHIEGNGNNVEGSGHHIEGKTNTCANSDNHVEGIENNIEANIGHIEGQKNNDISGAINHSEGRENNINVSSITHIEGNSNNIQNSTCCHIEGFNNSNTETIIYCHIEGQENKISAEVNNVHIEGYKNECQESKCHVEGQENLVKANCSHVEGYNHTINAGAYYSHVEGYNHENYAPYSHIEGYKNITLGNSSHVEGKNNHGEGVASHCGGEHNVAKLYCQTVLGCYAKYDMVVGDGTIKKYARNSVFKIGNGDTDLYRSDCFNINFNGNVYAEGTFHDGFADYAEMFEWNDGNESNEDRVGYFVTLIGNKIIKANTNSKYILGIVSANPSIIGNDPMRWKNKHLTDEWGRIIYENIEKTIQEDVLNENGIIETITKTITVEVPKINPNYNNNEEYIMRSDRKEWSAVGMLGILKVCQDGTLTVGEFCYPNADGIATKSESGYYVTRIINENIAEVIFK